MKKGQNNDREIYNKLGYGNIICRRIDVKEKRTGKMQEDRRYMLSEKDASSLNRALYTTQRVGMERNKEMRDGRREGELRRSQVSQ